MLTINERDKEIKDIQTGKTLASIKQELTLDLAEILLSTADYRTADRLEKNTGALISIIDTLTDRLIFADSERFRVNY